jgi:hypothetical protein
LFLRRELLTSRVPLSPLAVNLDMDISPAVVPSSKMGKGNLAPKNPPPGMVPPPPPTTPPPQRLINDAVQAAKVAAAASMAATPAAPPPKQGKEEKTEEEKKSFKAPTTFFSHEQHYYEPKRIDASKLRTAAESTYGRRGGAVCKPIPVVTRSLNARLVFQHLSL